MPDKRILALTDAMVQPLEEQFPGEYNRDSTRVFFAIRALAQRINDEANGWLAGLVASRACAALFTPVESIFVGLVAGILTPLMVELLELALSIDAPSGAITVHAASGLWGLLAAGFFAPLPGQLLAQIIGIATLLGLVLPMVYLLFWLVNRVVPFRVDPDGERIGMDLHELGGGAYPEFVIHRDESYR